MITESLVRVPAEQEVDLFVAEVPGPQETPLLVIHGGPDWDHSYLRDPLEQFTGTQRTLLPDLRGCGRSTRGLSLHDYTWHAAVNDLLGLLDVLGIGTAHVLGFSTGGAIAQRLTLAAPDRVRSLIVASSSVLPVPDDSLGEDLQAELEARMAQGSTLGPDSANLTGAEYNRAEAILSAPANVWRPEVLKDYLERLSKVRFSGDWTPGWKAGILGSSRPEDSAQRLAALKIPILLLHGRQDLTFPASVAYAAAEMIPAARAVVLDEAGHMAHIDQPEAWMAELQRFLDENPLI